MSRRLTDEQALSAPDMLLAGMTWQEIADEYGVSRNVIQRLFEGQTYCELQDRIQPKLAAARAAGRGRANRAYRRSGKRRCTKCETLLPETAKHFQSITRNGRPTFEARCLGCKKKQGRQRHVESRLRALRHYSPTDPPSCACCGEDEPAFLAIDHINGGGHQHRKRMRRGRGGVSSIQFWLEANGYPDGFRVLCHNCNQATGYYGRCPHKRQSD